MPLGLPDDDHSTAAGLELGSQLAWIWVPDEMLRPRFTDAAEAWLDGLSPKRSGWQRLWIGLMTLSALAVAGTAISFLVAALMIPAGNLPLDDQTPAIVGGYVFVVALVLLMVAIVGNAASRARSARHWPQLYGRTVVLTVRTAMDRVRARRAEFAPMSGPPPAAPLGVTRERFVTLAAEWLRFLGVECEVNTLRKGGVDILGPSSIARVIHSDEDARNSMREIVDAANDRQPVAILEAVPDGTVLEAAESASLAVFVMSPENRTFVPTHATGYGFIMARLNDRTAPDVAPHEVTSTA